MDLIAKDRERRLRKLTTDCQHFRGIQHTTCEAGVNMRELVGGDDHGWAARAPCLPSLDTPAVTCPKFKTRTKEEAEKVLVDSDKRLGDTRTAIVACSRDAKEKGFGQGHGGASYIPCPVCKTGTLRYSVASLNGHLWGQCSTSGCVNWMM
jgi:hypothetical protein